MNVSPYLPPLFSFFSRAQSAEKLAIPLYTTYSTPDQVNIKGRVLEYESSPKPQESSRWRNLLYNLELIESDEVGGVDVDIRFAGQTYRVRSDKEGLFELNIKPTRSLAEGYHTVAASLAPGQAGRYTASASVGTVVVASPHAPTVGIISDIDDTIQVTGVTSKWNMVKNILFKNEYTQPAIPGMAELFQALDQRNDGRIDGDVHYVSGSPVNLFDRLDRFMSLNGFPKGSLDLKNLGKTGKTDPLTQQIEYKLERIRNLFNAYPERKFMLFGDSGEKDPEVYRQIQQEFPDRVLGVYINNVTGDVQAQARYQGMLLTNNTQESARDAYARGWITSADLARVQQAVKR